MLNTDFSSKFVKEGLTFDDVLLIPYYLINPREMRIYDLLEYLVIFSTGIVEDTADYFLSGLLVTGKK